MIGYTLRRIADALERIANELEKRADPLIKVEPWWNASNTGAPHAHGNDFDVLTGDSGC